MGALKEKAGGHGPGGAGPGPGRATAIHHHVTRFEDHSIEVEDAGRGCPVDWNEKEQRFNWELVYCELYAGGKYSTTRRR